MTLDTCNDWPRFMTFSSDGARNVPAYQLSILNERHTTSRRSSIFDS